ncbi:MAG: urea ABC transporter permease subunit UrtB [Hahellaceae bacterium]|nr:urea ABC transporter permease subunit UrtB [Hahellaceae bacterium]
MRFTREAQWPLLTLLLTLFLMLGLSGPARAAGDLESALSELAKANFTRKSQLVDEIARLEDPRVSPVLTAFLDGALYQHKSSRAFVAFSGQDKGVNLLSGESIEGLKKRDFRKVAINNALRGKLRGIMAELQLRNPSLETRRTAAREMLKSQDAATLPLLKRAREKETDGDVRDLLAISIAQLNALHGEDDEIRIAAIRQLDGVLYPEVRVVLNKVAASVSAAEAKTGTVEAAAHEALKQIEGLISLNKTAENLYFGISLGSVLLLSAVGLAITFGVMGVINMAHGEMMMLGAYTTFVIQQAFPNAIDVSLFFAIPAAFLVAGGVGVLIERGIIRHLYGRPLETLLATFGISLVLQQAVRTIFSPLNQSVSTPSWMSGTLEINGALALTYNRLYIILFSLCVLAGLILLLKKTLFGLQMRAVTQNRRMASSMGIRTGWVDALTFGLGSGIAGVAGVALSQLTNVGPNLGQAYIIDSFMVVVFGGVGNLMGTFIGAMSLGIANKFLEPFAGAVLAKILILVFIILYIQKYPRGMFALKGRSAGD